MGLSVNALTLPLLADSRSLPEEEGEGLVQSLSICQISSSLLVG